MSDISHGEREWRIENSAEGIPLVFGDGKYPHDPPRVASELESALAAQLAEAVEALQAVHDYFWRPLGDATQAEAADQLHTVMAKVYTALGRCSP